MPPLARLMHPAAGTNNGAGNSASGPILTPAASLSVVARLELHQWPLPVAPPLLTPVLTLMPGAANTIFTASPPTSSLCAPASLYRGRTRGPASPAAPHMLPAARLAAWLR